MSRHGLTLTYSVGVFGTGPSQAYLLISRNDPQRLRLLLP